jgi:RNA 2',3'-cyclic 3'-phosphodiesterase
VRLFVAVDLEATVIAAAQSLARRLEERAASLAPGARITWIPPQLMHLTVRFIGNADEAMTTAISTVLRERWAVSPFELRIRDVGVFPPRGAPRVLWAGIEHGADQLIAVEQEVSARLLRLGVPQDDRPFTPHLTLARVRDAAGLRARDWIGEFEGQALGTSRVDAITLYESRISARGPTYVPLQVTPLQPA